ncbi:MAG: NADH-quinone oxidoreductase subunit A [Planctomycetia bacterium]|nr:NADH-quinone oxidoreductase subunit A [Planctomycetia bacterium]
MTTTSIVANVTLFLVTGFAFLFAALLLGRFLRARAPTREKLEIYECGEPAIGSGRVQFDLRFYVVALVFLILDVEAAFFFPWAVVFGNVTQLMGRTAPAVAANSDTPAARLSAGAEKHLRALGVARPELPEPGANVATQCRRIAHDARRLALAAVVDIAVFFGVVMVGFAYVWYRGDLDWVRAASRQPAARPAP